MPTPTKGPRLGGGPAHERLILANLATSLFEHDRITTTETKAKRLRPLAERLITFAKRGDLHARRQVLTVDPRQGRRAPAVHRDRARHRRAATVATPASPRSAPRKGDNAPMAVIELVREPLSAKQATVKEAEAATKRAAKDAAAATEAPAAEATVDEATPRPPASSTPTPSPPWPTRPWPTTPRRRPVRTRPAPRPTPERSGEAGVR